MMLTPTRATFSRPFYPLGNTPALSLTRDVPQGEDAHVLLLGCGDVRHILYTCYVERGLPRRCLDATCCDIEENVIARNALFFALILDSREGTFTDANIWNLYYQRYLDRADFTTLAAQAKKLLGLSPSLQAWHASPYGHAVRFCDHDSFSLVRAVWAKYEAALGSLDSPAYKDSFEAAMEASTAWSRGAVGNGIMLSHTSSRAAAPMTEPKILTGLGAMSERHWRTGLAGPNSSTDAVLPNPTFAAAISPALPLSTSADPVLSFHIATACAKLTDTSPLRLDRPAGKTMEDKIAEAAWLQFRAWAQAFRDASDRIVVRFAVADCFAFCQTLQHNLETGEASAHWYRREMEFRALQLAEPDYAKDGPAPRLFDMVDTSNISDYHGALNLLVSAGPLLKPAASSTLYTELMDRGRVSESAKFEGLLCGRTKAVSLLLGLTPIEYWTNALSVSIVDECLMSLAFSGEKTPKVQARLAWKRDRLLLSDAHPPPRRLSVKPEHLAAMAFSVYQDMFRLEDPSAMRLPVEDDRSKIFNDASVKYHRGSFVAFLKAVCKNVQTDHHEVGRLLLAKVDEDKDPGLTTGGSNYMDLCLHVSKAGLFTPPGLTGKMQRQSEEGPFCRWDDIPEAVAVTLVVPADSWKRVYRLAQDATNVLHVRCFLASGKRTHIYSDVQIGFGKINTRGSKHGDDFAVLVDEDPDRWNGNSPLIATCYMATATLQQDLASSLEVGLCLLPSMNNLTLFRESYRPKEGMLDLFRTRLQDGSCVFVSKHSPGQVDRPVIEGGLALLPGIQDLGIENGEDGLALVADVDESSGNIPSITGHLDIDTKEGINLLQDKVAITIHQTSPFTIEVVFGSRTLVLPITFPVPVDQEKGKTRIARKSHYVEVTVPLAVPLQTRWLEDFIFPTVLGRRLTGTTKGAPQPVTLNAPHVNLDGLPEAALDDRERNQYIVSHSSLMFSVRERAVRNEMLQASRTPLGGAWPRLSFKESLFTMINLASGTQGGRSQLSLFALDYPDHPARPGVQMVVFVSAVRLDGANATFVLDAALLPLTLKTVKSTFLNGFFQQLSRLQMCNLKIDEAELRIWRRMLPALVERCRTWTHGPKCEYRREGASVPLSLESGEPLLCSCGRGVFPDRFVDVPGWDQAAKFSTRIAISPLYASPFVEPVVDDRVGDKMLSPEPACRACGQSGPQEGRTLKRCMRCRKVSYCSAACQKKDWKTHRMECQEAGTRR